VTVPHDNAGRHGKQVYNSMDTEKIAELLKCATQIETWPISITRNAKPLTTFLEPSYFAPLAIAIKL